MCALTFLLTAASTAMGQIVPSRGPSSTTAPAISLEPVEVDPIRCWWRASAGAVMLGEPFDVRLTCAVLENDNVVVVPDETRLTVGNVPLKPFEIIGGDHPADTHAGERRFFQYRYTLRLLEPEAAGQDVSLPLLAITYKVQSRVGGDATLAGRDLSYTMPDISVRVMSQVPTDASDIRDGADVGLERVDALQFRARLFDIGALAFLAGGALLGVLALVGVISGAGAKRSRERTPVPDRRVLAAAGAELTRVGRTADAGWTPELVSAGHAALRVVAALALGRGVSEQPLAAGAQPTDGRMAVWPLMPRRPGAAITSVTTVADLGQAVVAAEKNGTSSERRAGLNALRDALATFTAAQFQSGDAALDAQSLSAALDAGRSEAERLARERRWPWSRVTRHGHE